ncbi:MAG: hypothetical protein BMS9Abin26_2008 [Gammaproteobacteria bacterium]|nr:MAG: hypothetical protein BMS9Abin26_2008 [Gammaproteobacteria bacterium]
MNDQQTILHGIADIEPPPLPAEAGTELLFWAVIIMVLLLPLLGALRVHYQQPRQTAIRKLRHLRNSLLSSSMVSSSANRRVAYEIARIFREGLGVHVLAASIPLPHSLQHQRHHWNEFMSDIDNARYSVAGCSDEQVSALISRANYWLKSWKQ